MSTFRTLREAANACMDDLRLRHANGLSPAGPLNVLRPDGDTDQYRIDARGRISRNRKPGHLTMGMWIEPSDLPCVIG